MPKGSIRDGRRMIGNLGKCSLHISTLGRLKTASLQVDQVVKVPIGYD